MNNYLIRRNVKVAASWIAFGERVNYFNNIYFNMNVKQGSTRRGCGFECVCAHALVPTWPCPGTLTLDLLIAACRSHQLLVSRSHTLSKTGEGLVRLASTRRPLVPVECQECSGYAISYITNDVIDVLHKT